MTVLRFGTDTGQVTPRDGKSFTSVRGRLSQRVTARQTAEETRACVRGIWTAIEGSPAVVGGLAGIGRLQTSRGLAPLFGVALRPSRIDTLKRRDSTGQRVFGRRETWTSKRMRGGRKPNG